MAFARKHMHWNLRQWKYVIWSDKSIFTVSYHNNNYVQRRVDSDPFDPKYLSKSVKHSPKLMVSACFDYKAIGKIIVLLQNQTMNKEMYLHDI